MYDTIIAVNAFPSMTYDFLKEGETEQTALERAREHYCNQYEKEKEFSILYDSENNHYWQDQAKRTWKIIEEDFSIMPFDDYITWQKKQLTSDAPEEITKEEYNDMLNILPPLKWGTYHNVESFCMSEFYTGTLTNQYAYNLVNGKYYRKLVDITDRNTWIYNDFE